MGNGSLPQTYAYRVMLRKYPDVMSVQEMCEVLGISTKTGYEILRTGKISCLKVGRAYRIPKIHLLNYLFYAGPEPTAAQSDDEEPAL